MRADVWQRLLPDAAADRRRWTDSIREVTLPEMSARAFELIVECLYTALLGSIDATNAMELLEPVAAGWGRRGAVVVWESAEWYDTSRRQSRTPPAMSVVGGDVRLRASTGFCTQWAEKMSMEIPS